MVLSQQTIISLKQEERREFEILLSRRAKNAVQICRVRSKVLKCGLAGD